MLFDIDYTAILLTEEIRSNTVCLNFWYSINKSSKSSLRIFTKIRNQMSAHPLWSIEGNQGENWRPAAVTVDIFDHYQV